MTDDDQQKRARSLHAKISLRFEQLDQISRARALNEAESIELERLMQRLGLIETSFSRRLSPALLGFC